MEIMTGFTIQRNTNSTLKKVNFEQLEFGKNIADHMVVADWKNGTWTTPTIVPYGVLKFTPALLTLHYGQSIFEGMKAFKTIDGRINIFRPKKHHERMNKSLQRMCMPVIPYDMFIQLLHQLVDLDRHWVPSIKNGSLYLRPFVFATEERLGVGLSQQYKFIIITSPAGPYYSKPLRLKVETHYTRTCEGGPGFAKCAGNYGGALYPTKIAQDEGYDQILWTDHKDHKYIDEVGMMNVMFVLNNQLITPQLSTAILDGVTRDSILTLARQMSMPVEERKVSIDDLKDGFKNKILTESFGVGTAAVVAPIASIHINGVDYNLPPIEDKSIQNQMKNKLLEIRTGAVADTNGWNYIF